MTIEQFKNTEEYEALGYKEVKCPICGHTTLNNFWECSNCGWEFDGTILDEEYSSANKSTIKDYKEHFIECHIRLNDRAKA